MAAKHLLSIFILFLNNNLKVEPKLKCAISKALDISKSNSVCPSVLCYIICEYLSTICSCAG
jgi:hypothetical protein